MYEKLVKLLQATTQKINSKACVFEQKTEVELLRDEYLPPLSLNYVVYVLQKLLRVKKIIKTCLGEKLVKVGPFLYYRYQKFVLYVRLKSMRKLPMSNQYLGVS